jgi:hypothetical protein
MKPVECEFEAEVLAAVIQSRWPGRVDAGLRAHVRSCAICSDVVVIAGALDDSGDEMRAQALVPDARLVWWRSQLRARREAVEAAGRPITAAQVIAFGCAMGLLGACLGATSTWFQSLLSQVTSSFACIKIQALLVPTAALMAEHGAFLLTMAALLVLVPAVVCVALLRD